MTEFIQSLTDGRTWVRVVMVIVGAILIYMALLRTDPLTEFVNALKGGVGR